MTFYLIAGALLATGLLFYIPTIITQFRVIKAHRAHSEPAGVPRAFTIYNIMLALTVVCIGVDILIGFKWLKIIELIFLNISGIIAYKTYKGSDFDRLK